MVSKAEAAISQSELLSFSKTQLCNHLQTGITWWIDEGGGELWPT